MFKFSQENTLGDVFNISLHNLTSGELLLSNTYNLNCNKSISER